MTIGTKTRPPRKQCGNGVPPRSAKLQHLIKLRCLVI